MNQLESKTASVTATSVGIFLLNAVTNNWLREQIQHFTDIAGIQSAREYGPGSLVISGAEIPEFPVDNNIRTGTCKTEFISESSY